MGLRTLASKPTSSIIDVRQQHGYETVYQNCYLEKGTFCHLEGFLVRMRTSHPAMIVNSGSDDCSTAEFTEALTNVQKLHLAYSSAFWNINQCIESGLCPVTNVYAVPITYPSHGYLSLVFMISTLMSCPPPNIPIISLPKLGNSYLPIQFSSHSTQGTPSLSLCNPEAHKEGNHR